MYNPTWVTAPLFGPTVSKNIKSPAFKLLLLTDLPYLLWADDVLGNVIPAEFLNT